MAWRLARSLEVLRAEFDALAPHRSKVSDGTIGNAEHASRASRHNPNKAGVVTGMDITHNPAGGCDVHAIVREVIVPHPPLDLDYVISNRQVASREHGWTWRPYTGADDHTHHAHFGVGRGPDSNPVGPYDDTEPWGVATHQFQEDEDMDIFELTEAVAVEREGGKKGQGGQLWFRVGDRFTHLTDPNQYLELCKELPGRGLEKSTVVSNGVVWMTIKTGKG